MHRIQQDMQQQRQATHEFKKAAPEEPQEKQETKSSAHQRNTWRKVFLLFLMLAVGTVLYSWLVWPTPYITVHVEEEVIRVNRFTGIREWATEKGWMTQEQIAADKKVREEAKSKRVLEELKKINVDDTHNDLNKLGVHNPTGWKLSLGAGVVEYYSRSGSVETFLCKDDTVERRNYFMKPGTYNDFNLTDGMLPWQTRNLPVGTHVVQKITITFDKANDTTRAAEDKYVELQPPFVLKHERTWVVRTTEEVP